MHRVVIELPIVALAAAVIASLVLVAGTAMEASTAPIAPTYTFRPAPCTVSYCEPPELILTSAARSEPLADGATSVPDEE